MHPVSWIVCGAALLTTIWLVAYVMVYLPRRMEERFQDSMKAFSTAIELRFPSHEGLSLRVVGLSKAVARELRLSDSQMRDLETAAHLRDIGLCAIPYSLVNSKPTHQWDPAERLTYDRHPEVSGAMLELVPPLQHLAEIVRCHHARFDGCGEEGTPYGRQLPIESRVLKVVTEYVWNERWQGNLIAKQRIRDGLGTEYCPDVVAALWAVLTSTRVPSSRSGATVR
jgi:response regulator RpfG family c-di-GMP phosphodiesterase